MRRAIVLGLSWGAFCGITDGVPLATTLAQMAVPWIWVAAFVAYREANSTKLAALLGGVTLLAANTAYFGIGSIARGISGLDPVGGVQFFALWATVGLIVGPIAGVLGWWLTARASLAAVVILATVSIAEPLALWTHINHVDAHLAYIGVAAVGLAFPLVWFRRSWHKALQATALVLILTYPIAVALEAALIAFGQISSPMRLI